MREFQQLAGWLATTSGEERAGREINRQEAIGRWVGRSVGRARKISSHQRASAANTCSKSDVSGPMPRRPSVHNVGGPLWCLRADPALRPQA